jgi:hypothetical protein
MEVTSKMVDAALESTTPGEGPCTLEQALDFSGADTARRVVKAALLAALAATPAPASDEVLAELEKRLDYLAHELPWFSYGSFKDTGEEHFYVKTPKGPVDIATFDRDNDGIYALAACNAAPALLARVRQAEAKASATAQVFDARRNYLMAECREAYGTPRFAQLEAQVLELNTIEENILEQLTVKGGQQDA